MENRILGFLEENVHEVIFPNSFCLWHSDSTAGGGGLEVF